MEIEVQEINESLYLEMEKLLYEMVFEKICESKSCNSLGMLASFLRNDFARGKGVLSEKTIKRGFRQFLNPDVLDKYKWASKKESSMPYIPDVNTLNILAIYLDYQNFSDFCGKNRTVSQDTKETKSKTTVTVYQSGNYSSSYGDVNAQGDIIFNSQSDV